MRRIALLLIVASSGVAFADPNDSTLPSPQPGQPGPAQPVMPTGPQSGDGEAIPGEPPRPVVVTAAPVVTSTPVPTEATPFAPATGTAVEIMMQAGPTFLDDDVVFSTMSGALFLGGRTESLTIGVGLELERIAEGTEDSMGGSSSQSRFGFFILPGFRVSAAHSADRRTELLVAVDGGYGALTVSNDNSGSSTPTTHRFRIQAGLSIRYWVSQSFAFGATAGPRYERWSRTNDGGGGGFSSTSMLSQLAMFGSLALIGVF